MHLGPHATDLERRGVRSDLGDINRRIEAAYLRGLEERRLLAALDRSVIDTIRLTFTYEGRRERRTLMLNTEPIAPTQVNIKYAHRLASEIREKIKYGTFSMLEYFPATGVVTPLTVGAQLDAWLAGQRIEQSTRAGYESAVRFWKGAPAGDLKLGDIALRSLKTGDTFRVWRQTTQR